MNDQVVSFDDIIKIFTRNASTIALSFALCLVGTYAASLFIPTKYKAKAILSIPASYFQIAMANDILPGINDANEQAAQRQSLMRLALSDAFIDDLGLRYHIYKSTFADRRRSEEREALLARIEYFNLSPTSFQISVMASDPQVSFQITNDVLSQMKGFLIEDRHKTLVKTRDAIESHVQSLSMALQDVSSAMIFQHDDLQSELDKVEARKQALTNQYTNQHPEVLKLQERSETIRALLRKVPATPTDQDPKSEKSLVVMNSASKVPVQEVYADLVKKLNYLNIVVDMDNDRENVPYLAVIEKPTIPNYAFFPTPKIYAMGGLVAFIFLTTVLIIYNELKRGTFLSPSSASANLNAPFLGELPVLVSADRIRLLDGPRR